MEKETTVEVIDKPEAPAPIPTPTRDELAKQGWTPEEMTRAEEKGLLPKADAKPEAPVKEEEKSTAPVKPEVKVEPQAKPSSLPDFTMTPDQEKVFMQTFGDGTAPRAMYFRMKNERRARQTAEAKAKELEAQLAQAKAAPPPEVDPDDEDRPLTLKQLRELQQQELKQLEARETQNTERTAIVSSAQLEQEEYARSLYTDFDDTVTRAKDVMQNLDTLVPEKWKQAKVVKLIRDLQITAANADKLGLDDYNAAMIAYEIGQLHPEHGKALTKTGPTNGSPKADGGLTPEKMRKLEEQNQRRASSASIGGGGGKRVISVDEVDLAVLNGMSLEKRMKFRDQHPEKYAKLMRG